MQVQRPVTITIAAGGTASTDANLGSYHQDVFVQIPSMTSASSFLIDHSFDGGTTYYPMFHPPINSSTVGQNLVVITITVGTNGGYFQIPGGGSCFRFRVGTAPVGATFIRVIGSK